MDKADLFVKEIASPLGSLWLLANSNSLISISWTPAKNAENLIQESNAIIETTHQQLNQYFARKRSAFDIPISIYGTTFQAQVWHSLQEIPFGTTVSYAYLAKLSGNDAAIRAVGSAVGKNPLPIIIPCHRIIGSDGTLRGFAGGLPRKKILLDLEAQHQKNTL